MIRKASEIVSKNSEDFELPFGESDDSDILEVIIDEWKAYQSSSSGMGKAVIIENIKPNAISQKEAGSLKKVANSISESWMNNLVTIEAGWDTFSQNTSYTPFLSGVAINAP